MYHHVIVIVVTRILFCFAVVTRAKENEGANVAWAERNEGLRYASCSQERNNIKCENWVHRQEDDAHEKSNWPPGPYAIPMTVDGCPETRLQGWEKGYLSVTWNKLQTVLTKNSYNENDSLPGEYRDVLQTRLPAFQSHIFGPYSNYEFRMNFCYKLRRNDTLDTGRWPSGDYSVYRADDGCPNGFTSLDHDVNLPNVSYWFYDGYVPGFQFDEVSQNALHLRLCKRVQEGPGTSVENHNSMLDEASFMFIQSNGEDCPGISNFTVQSESIYIGEYQQTDTTEVKFFQTYCFYQNIQGITVTDTRDNNNLGYRVATAVILKGNVSSTSTGTSNENLFNLLRNEGTPENGLKDMLAVHWRLIDLGRTISVSAIKIHFIDGVIAPGYDTTSTQLLNHKIRCLISDHKWSFLHFGAFNCPYVPYFQSYGRILNLLLVRTKQGRFVTLLGEVDEMEILNKTKSFDVFTQRVGLETVDSCNTDLGMTDGGVLDFQITASSFYPIYPPSSARLLSSGWCARDDDREPFLMSFFFGTGEIYSWSGKSYFALSAANNNKTNLNFQTTRYKVEMSKLQQNILCSANIVRHHTISCDVCYICPVTEKYQKDKSENMFVFFTSTNNMILRYISFTIDLLHLVKVEGLTISNWEQITSVSGRTKVFLFGCKSVLISYGTSRENLRSYSMQEFRVDTNRPITEWQTIWLYKAFYARYVKIQIKEGLMEGLSCLRIELHGCRMLGIPSLYCPLRNEMINNVNPLPISVTGEVAVKTATSFEACKEHCNQTKDCNAITFTNQSVCSLYRPDKMGNWRFLQVGDKTLTSTKLCMNNGFTNVPALLRKEHSKTAVISYVSSIYSETFSTSVGYPFSYPGGQHFKWIVSFEKDTYVKLIFTNVSLHVYSKEDDYDCNDSIRISENLHEEDASSREIDSRLNGHMFTIETSVSRLVMTFTSCLPFARKFSNGYGFRSIFTKQDIPACYSLNSHLNWEQGRSEICLKDSMTLTPMSTLGMPFIETTEQWQLYFPRHRIQLQFIQFQVRCPRGTLGSEFKINDFGKERTYCTLDMPPSIMDLLSDFVNVTFYKAMEQSDILYTEGFVIQYTLTFDSTDEKYISPKSESQVWNIALGKPATFSSQFTFDDETDLYKWSVTDGISHPDHRSGTCFHSQKEYEPWWLVDLQDVYAVEWIVIYNRKDCCRIKRSANLEISTGLTLENLSASAFKCDVLGTVATLELPNISTRYVKLQMLYRISPLQLCEVQVFGRLETISDRKVVVLPNPTPVDGQWGNWGPWSDLCFCNSSQPRRRICDSPRPRFSGHTCTGSNTSYRSCIPGSQCELQNVGFNKIAFTSSVYLNNTAELGIDGDLSTCFHTEKEYQPWWIVDLKHIYNLHHLVIHNLKSHAPRTKSVEITAGFSVCTMTTIYYKCGEPIPDTKVYDVLGTVARYIKLQLMGIKEYLHLCEVEIHGQNASTSMMKLQAADDCDQQTIVDGGFSEWTTWDECSEACGHGTRARTRICTNPAPSNGGKPCYGDYKDIQSCVKTCSICSHTFEKCYDLFPQLTNWRHAGVECWQRGTQLVSIKSKAELRFIKYLLRENRYKDGLPIPAYHKLTLYTNASHYTHIGLHREDKESDETVTHVWEDSSPVTYNAWNDGQPSEGNCTRMNYRLLTYDNTWETEDCETQLAEYFICEKPFEEESVSGKAKHSYVSRRQDWKLTITELVPSLEYDGKTNVTLSGKACQSWSDPSNHPDQPFDDIMFPEQSRYKARNYCRDPRKLGFLWCHMGPGVLDFEECPVIITAQNVSNIHARLKYMGKINTTYSGKTCQPWAVISPHYNILNSMNFPGETTKSVRNYCRDPWDNGYQWCFTMDPNTRWEPCVIPDDLDEICNAAYRKYRGPMDITFSGKACQEWNVSFLHNFQGNRLSEILDVVSGERACRDPLNEGFLWCFIKDGSREPCTDDFFKGRDSNNYTHDFITFKCKSGQHIPMIVKCDGKFDCKDFSDETDCLGMFEEHILSADVKLSTRLPPGFENGSYFRCQSLEWVSVVVRCDGVIDCLDASDEIGCDEIQTAKAPCLFDQFQCIDGDCIHISHVCNFVPDCIDKSDENCNFGICPTSDYFTCDNQQCIPIQQRCNSEPDCLDESDERSCYECQADVAFHCDVGRCIAARLRCDNYKDCVDGSDEKDCDLVETTSCVDLWEEGNQLSGRYSGVIPYTEVKCNFDSIFSLGKIYTVLPNSDYAWNKAHNGYALINRITFWVSDEVMAVLLTKRELSCTQEIKQSCIPSHVAASRIDDMYHTKNYKHCQCVLLKVNLRDKNKFIYPCDAQGFLNRSYNTSDLVYRYREFEEYRFLDVTDLYSAYHQIFAGPVICEQEYTPQMDRLFCLGNVKAIPNTLKCVYDVDKIGIMIGCRSASHLDTCENFTCPEDTVRCPSSYCIPIKFVCDGKIQCPGGQDEENCGCSETGSEVIIIYDADGDNVNVEEMSRQFYTNNGSVRMLSYTQERPLKEIYNLDYTVLKIAEKRSLPFSSVNRLPTCQYKLMASSFLRDIAFSKNTGSKRGIIFIENSKAAKVIAGEMFRNVQEKRQENVIVYRVLQDPFTKITEQHEYEHVTDVRVRRWKVFAASGASFFPGICTLSSKIRCANAYRCAWSKNCIPLHQVCDGYKQCIHGDDEQLCNFICLTNCQCSGYAVFCSNKSIHLSQIDDISKNTRLLDLSKNINLRNILEHTYVMLQSLVSLNLSMCQIEDITEAGFRRVVNLRSLDLSYNLIKVLTANIFILLEHLLDLNLRGNTELTVIESGAFKGLVFIRELHLSGTKIRKIAAKAFEGLRFTSIDLSKNEIEEIEPLAFSDLFVEIIDFESNEISNFNKEIFTGVMGLRKLVTPAFKFCCIRPNYLDEEQCYPKKDEFSSCEDLMRLSALQTMLWLIGLTAIIGNALSIFYRLTYDRERLKIGFGIFVTNLALADFLMGVYLMIIAIADAVFRKRYIFNDDYWRNSVWCNVAGFLSTLSSEASVMFLCLITLDRLLVIKFPFGQMRLDRKKANILASVCWLLSLIIATVPLIFVQYFKNKFYTKSGVCIALPLTRDRPPGWMYSVVIFLCLNFLTFVLVAVGQIAIFLEIRKTSSAVGFKDKTRKRDLKIARNLLLVVATDFLCWFPIGVMGLMALSGHAMSGDVYAWAAVFILPVNSALNPILYTVSAIIGQKTFNPSTDEQNRLEIISEFGKRILDFQTISPSFIAGIRGGGKEQDTYEELRDVLTKSKGVSTRSTVRIAFQLAKILEILHSNSLVLRQLSVETVSVSVTKKKNQSIKIRIKEQPTLTHSPRDLCNDMGQYGRIVKALIATRNLREWETATLD